MMSGPCGASRPQVLTRPLVFVFAPVFGFSTAFYPLLSVILFNAATTGAGWPGSPRRHPHGPLHGYEVAGRPRRCIHETRTAAQQLRLGRGPADFGANLAEVARAAEEAGFDRIAVADHLWQHPIMGGPEADEPECYATLAFLAAHTERVNLGAMVSGVHFRHPAMLAKTVTTLDVLSGGRAWLGVGSGHYEEETRGLGIPFPPQRERFEMLEETVQICGRMWAGERGDEQPFEGKHYSLERPLNLPQSLTRPHPPIMIAGDGEKKTLRLVARYADACSLRPSPEIPKKLDVLRRHCEAEGREYGGDREDLRVRLRCRGGGRKGGRAPRATALALRDGYRDRDRNGPRRGPDLAA